METNMRIATLGPFNSICRCWRNTLLIYIYECKMKAVKFSEWKAYW